MSQFIEIKQTERNFKELNSINDAFAHLKVNYTELKFYVKYDIDKIPVQIIEINDDTVISIATDPVFVPDNKKIVIYALLDKYIEIECYIEETRGPGFFKCKINSIKRAAGVRKELRIKVNPDQVLATNFMISKQKIDVSNFKVPTSTKVLLDQFQSDYSTLSDIVKVELFDKEDILLETIRKSGKTLYIEDLANPNIEKVDDNTILKIEAELKNLVIKNLKKYSDKNYKSLIISPIIYKTDSENLVSFAYVILISKTTPFSLEKVHELNNLLKKLVNRIKDSNTQIISANQHIIDLSKSGAKILITDENLKKYAISAKGFVFNIIFKLQAPVTIYGEIRSTYKDNEGNMFVGISFAGHSSRKDEMKRYNSFIDPLINEYKKNLLKQRKA